MLEPLLSAGPGTLRVRLTRRGERFLLARRRPLAVSVTVRARDVSTQESVGGARGRLDR